MKPTRFILSSLLLFYGTLSAQTWNETVANIFYENCAACHNENGIGGFPLTTYSEVVNNYYDIQGVIASGEMPPWPADPTYRHFTGEKVLNDWEMSTLQNWFTNGMQQGTGEAPPVPEFYPGPAMTNADFVWNVDAFEITSDEDVYRSFVIALNNTETEYLKGTEFIPGNSSAVHHYQLFYTTSSSAIEADNADPGPGFATNGNTNPVAGALMIKTWAPGDLYQDELPIDAGAEILPNAYLILEIHYAPGHAGETDATEVRLKFADDPENTRPTWTDPLLYHYQPCLQEPFLIIPANTTATFHQISEPIGSDITVLSVFPHMHLLGQTYKVWMITPELDSIPVISIDSWDFHWQYTYVFQQPLMYPANSVFYAEALYDNTANNEENPNDPPETVILGSGSEDEMMLVYFTYTYYLPGDENIVFDSTLLSVPAIENSIPSFYPNPSGGKFYAPASGVDDIHIVDICGRELVDAVGTTSSAYIKIDLGELPAGIYLVKYRWNNQVITQRLVKN